MPTPIRTITRRTTTAGRPGTGPGYRGQVEVILKGVRGVRDVRVNGAKNGDWRAGEQGVVARFASEGSAQVRVEL